MSVELTLVRTVTHFCIDDVDAGIAPRSYIFIEIMTHGWATGNKWRTRRFATFPAVFAYLNKVFAGRWMDDDSYEAAWMKVLRLQDEMFSRRFTYAVHGDVVHMFDGFYGDDIS